MKIYTLPCLIASTAFLSLAGCVESHSSAPPPAANGVAATVSEADTGHTVRIGLGETIAFRLAVNETTGNRWFLRNGLAGGVLAKKGNTTYAPTPKGTVATLIYQGMHPGTQELHFTYAPPDARQNVARAADFRVIVR